MSRGCVSRHLTASIVMTGQSRGHGGVHTKRYRESACETASPKLQRQHTHLGVVNDALQCDGVDAARTEHRQRVFAGEHDARSRRRLAHLPRELQRSGQPVHKTQRTVGWPCTGFLAQLCAETITNLTTMQLRVCSVQLCQEITQPLGRRPERLGHRVLRAQRTCRSRPSGPQHASGGCCESHISTHVSVMDTPWRRHMSTRLRYPLSPSQLK